LAVAEAAVAVEEGLGAAGVEVDEVAFEALVGEDGSGFEGGEDGSFGLGEAEAGFDEGVGGEGGIDGEEELVEAGAAEGGDGDGGGVGGEGGKLLGGEEIDLVEDVEDGLAGDGELGEDGFDLEALLVAYGTGGVLDVEEDFGALDLFEGGAEAGDEGVGEVADEADGVRQEDAAAGGELELAELGVEGGEHAGGLEDAGVG